MRSALQRGMAAFAALTKREDNSWTEDEIDKSAKESSGGRLERRVEENRFQSARSKRNLEGGRGGEGVGLEEGIERDMEMGV